MSDTLSPRLRVMLLEDHVLVRHSMELLLKHEYGLDIAGSFCTPRQLFEALKEDRPDVIVTDYALSATDTDGAKLLRSLHLHYPHVRVLVVSSHCNAPTIALAMRAGAHGFIGKTQHETELYLAIRTVAAGRTYFGRHLPEPASSINPIHQSNEPGKDRGDGWLNAFNLSTREHEVLRCILDGMPITAIAKKFSRSVTTISAQKHSAFRKLGVCTSHELFKVLYQHG
ncbi:response regulator transcription factor [Dyella choica]|uniref:Response regulator transcription factor n=1 Tax=Dyella choica TaxID=1927959 RepID=A0A3S0PJ74_9GAMM|nr:response regulator transcription factor [Dyella choica]RUL70516.1 response regulator transcription factor [Dyella choica]